MKGKILSLMRCLILAAAILPCFCSCSDETKLSVKNGSGEKAEVAESVTLDSLKGSSKTIYVSVEETGWTARVAPDCDFFSVSPDRGTESGYLTITATSDNVTGKDRVGTVIIESTALKDGKPQLSQTIKITQTVVRLDASLIIPAEALQHGDFIILYQPKNGEKWERTLTADDFALDPNNSQCIIHHLNLPVNAETGKMSLWFRNHSNGYTFNYTCQHSQIQRKDSHASIITFANTGNIIAEKPQTDYLIACFLWELTDNGFYVNNGSETDFWPELTSEQKNSVASAVASVLKKAHDNIDSFLVGETPDCKFSESLPADIFDDNIDIEIRFSREGELIQLISVLTTAERESWYVYRKYNATDVKATLASSEFSEEMTTRTEWQIRKILNDRLSKQ